MASSEPWIEKYRPTDLSEVVGNEEIINTLREIVKNGNIPNFILSGPPGTGKTTSIMAMAHEILKDNFKKATIELNASDERGINVVREKIKSFAQQKVLLPPGQHKIIILDEADHLTEAAQAAMRVTITDYTNTTRFALACNDSSKIIEAIQSRCTVLRFNKLTDNQIYERVKKVIEMEIIPYDEGGINAIVETSQGDMRNALNNLQACFMTYGKITEEIVYKIVDIPKPKEIEKILDLCKEGNIKAAITANTNIIQSGYIFIEVIGVFNRVIMDYPKISEKCRINLLRIIADFKVNALEGISDKLQQKDFIVKVYEAMKNEK